MTELVAKALMRLAACSLGEGRREWALAMQGEYEAAVADGRPLAFAAGCLIAAWREMPMQGQGRFVLANYALALGVLMPMAVLEVACVAGFPYSPLGPGGLSAVLTPGSAQQYYLSEAYPSARPALLVLWFLLGIGHVRLAWLLVERDWAGVLSVAALTVAASATLVIFTVVLFIDDATVALQAALLAVELAAVYGSARWHARLFAGVRPVFAC